MFLLSLVACTCIPGTCSFRAEVSRIKGDQSLDPDNAEDETRDADRVAPPPGDFLGTIRPPFGLARPRLALPILLRALLGCG